jgi:hypothetical protein
MKTNSTRLIAGMLALSSFLYMQGCTEAQTAVSTEPSKTSADATPKETDSLVLPRLDTADYNQRMHDLCNGDSSGKWPVKAPYPLAGALLPYNRIIAYYGNLYSKRMGILGELPKREMIRRLKEEVSRWQAADSSMRAIPALHYIAVTAQGTPGKDNKHRLRMPFHQVDTVIRWAREIDAVVFLDIQVGHSTVKEEVPRLEKYMQSPDVHLAIDPEFSLKNGEVPGSRIGTFNSEDINDAIDFLAAIVRKHQLPPKVLVVHRFTQGMITDYQKIKKVPEVQLVIDMDGFGDKILKRSTYLRYIYKEPVQFTGFKLFYKNDNRPNGSGMFTPSELLRFKPRPVYIQYQ